MRILTTAVAALAMATLTAKAQTPAEGTQYYLPKTGVRLVIQIEKTTYTPGDFAGYAWRFLKLNASAQPDVSYRIVDAQMSLCSEPDTARHFRVKTGEKTGISHLVQSDNGILLGVNGESEPQTLPDSRFVPSPKPRRLNPRDYMSQEILSAGSTMKMAELTAQDIYDIRDSRNQLSRGQADFMPKDGEQLKLMLQKLDVQEQALLQLFSGTVDRDTSEVTVEYVPERETSGEVLFRFSKKLGLLDKDDLAGSPYYVSVEDEHSVPAPVEDPNAKKKKLPVMYACMPGKIKLSLSEGAKPWKAYEIYAAQFGHLNPLDEDLFNKKVVTTVILNPYTGGIQKIKTEQAK